MTSVYAMTVKGPIEAGRLAFTLPHEHLVCDVTFMLVEPKDDRKRRLVEAPVSIEILGELLRDPLISRDNLTLTEEQLAAKEVELYREAGGRTIVDLSTSEMKRNPDTLRRLSEQTGVNIIAATGHSVDSLKPREARETAEEMAGRMVREIRDGIGESGIRPGVIAVALTGKRPSDEKKVVQAAAMAQADTGLPISIHSPFLHDERGLEIISTLRKAGANIDRVIMGHRVYAMGDVRRQLYEGYRRQERAIVDSGATIEYDQFGAEFYYQSWGASYRAPRDAEVADRIAALVKDGYGDRVLISHGTCYKIQLSAYGGFGLAHIPHHIVLYLRDRGLSDDQVDEITIRNPARLFGVLGKK